MRSLSVLTMAAVLGLIVGLAPARADEKEIPLKDVPKAVIDAIKAKFPGAKLKEAAKEEEDGKTVYEVELVFNNDEYTVEASADGKILAVEKEIEVEDLPAAVTAALKAKYPGAKLDEAEEVTEGTTISYEVIVKTADKKTWEVKLDKTGKILKTEEADDKD